MPRRPPSDRLAKLIACATRVFIAQGYRRTQMDDVAAALGVAKGTLYLSVASKAALFDLVVRHADALHPPAEPEPLPIQTPAPAATLAFVQQRVEQVVIGPALAAARRGPAPRDVRAELGAIVRELYAMMSAQRTAIKVIDRCASDYPELAAVWYRAGRETQLGALRDYLLARIDAGRLRPVPDATLAARLIMETVVTWAVHRHWDAAPQPMSEATVQATVEQFLVDALAPPRRQGARAPRPQGGWK